MRHTFISFSLTLALILGLILGLTAGMPGTILAHDQEQGQKTPEDLLEQGTRDILRAFELFLLTIPQYSAPEILDNGDIIIRRLHPGPKHPNPEQEDEKNQEDQTRT